MQSQMIGMQSSLDRILAAVQQGNPFPNGSRDVSMFPPVPPMRNGEVYTPSPGADGPPNRPKFPPLPGFAPPVRASRVSAPILDCLTVRFAPYSPTNTPRMESSQALRRHPTTSRKTHSLVRP